MRREAWQGKRRVGKKMVVVLKKEGSGAEKPQQVDVM